MIGLAFIMPLNAVGTTVLENNDSVLSGTLSARPKLCMTERKDRSCTMTVELSWQTNQANNFCIYSSQDHSLIGCWSNLTQGNKTIPIQSTESISYKLILNQTSLQTNSKLHDADIITSNTIASTTVSILSVMHKSSQKNRRRRHAWSLF